MVGEITFLTHSVNNVNKRTLTLDMMQYIANMANTPGTEENSANVFQGRRKHISFEHCLTLD